MSKYIILLKLIPLAIS